MQAAVACNTQVLVQRNIAARAVRMSKQATPARAVFSPCGMLVAWHTGQTLVVRDRRARRQIASQPLPSEPQNTSLRWSYDSSHISACCATKVVVVDIASCSPMHIDTEHARLTGVWAPSAQVLALFRPAGDAFSIHAFGVAGQEAHVQAAATRMQVPNVRSLAWAAHSKLLAVEVPGGHRVFNTVSQTLLETAVSCKGLVAWSPSTWDAPHLLSLDTGGNVQFLDQTGRTRGGSVQAVRQAHALLWGEHGVLVLDKAGTWLFTVCTNVSELSLILKCHMAMSELFCPVLSPDQLHLCVCRVTLEERVILCDLVIWNLVSERHALIRLPEPLSTIPDCSWTSRGYSLAVVQTFDRASKHQYKMFRFVF